MNKKGFTMIELLAVIVILGLLLGVGIPAVNKVLANFRLDYYKKLEGTLATAGQEFISDKRYQKPTELMYSRVITKEELVGGKYIDEILDYKENECAGSYVVVAKIGDKHYEYQACLKCETDEYETDTSNKEYDLCNIAWQDNENIDYGAVNDKEKLWVYYGTPANEIKNELGLSYGITKKDSEGKVIAQAEGMDNKIVYPNNINELVSANLDKEVTLRYELPTGESVNRKAEMYRFSVPTVSLKYGANNVATGKHTGDTYTQGEWTSSLNVTIGYNEKDKEKYRDFIEQSTKFTVEWYNQTTKKWEIGATCNTKGLTSCTWNINRDFNAVTKFRIKDYKGHPSMETGNYKLQVDVQKPSVTLTRQTYNTYNWTATEKGESGLRGYRYSTSNTVPTSYTTSGTINSGSKTISSEATNYVWVVDRAGNANSASIASYTVKRSQGAGTSLTTKYETSSGTTFTSNLVVLNGTKIYVSGTSSAGYSGIVVKKNGTAITNNAQTTISANSTISSEATICAAGSYSGAGAATCTKCPAGTYASGTGSTSCTKCAKGTYAASTGSSSCAKASCGHYVDTEGASSQKTCAAGTYSSEGAATCTSATAGHYVASDGACSQTACAKGTYQSGTGKTSCTQATCGHYVSSTGATSQATCAAGTYSAAGAATCTSATAGHYVASAGACSQTACAKGTYQSGTGKTSCTQATCGHYVSSTGATSQATCAAGTYSAAGAASCTSATAGHYVASAGACSQTACAKGTYQSGTGKTSCSSCAAGTYASSTGSSSCTNASCGHYVASAGASSQTACAAGTYQDGTGKTSCKSATAGHYVASAGACSQAACAKGTYQSGTGKTSCSNCAAGTYASSTGSSSCTNASCGHYVASAGASSQTACAAGTYQSGTGKTSCTNASKGYYVASAGSCSQTKCPANKYQNETGKSSCKNCPAGTESSAGASSCTSTCTLTFTNATYVESGNNGGRCWNTCKGTECQKSHLHWEHNCSTPSTGGSRKSISHSGYSWNWGGQGSRMCYYNPDSSPYFSDLWERCDTSEAYYNNSAKTAGGTFCFNSAQKWDYYRSSEYGIATVCYGTQCGQRIICTGSNCN